MDKNTKINLLFRDIGKISQTGFQDAAKLLNLFGTSLEQCAQQLKKFMVASNADEIRAALDAKDAEIERLRGIVPEVLVLGRLNDELCAENERMRAALQWVEDKARAGKIEIAPSLLGTGFEFGFWPSGSARVATAKTLLEAIEVALASSLP